MGHQIAKSSIPKLLDLLQYRRQVNRKTLEGSRNPDRDAQFEHINAGVLAMQAAGKPVISIDTKKKELVGDPRAKPEGMLQERRQRLSAGGLSQQGEGARFRRHRTRQGHAACRTVTTVATKRAQTPAPDFVPIMTDVTLPAPAQRATPPSAAPVIEVKLAGAVVRVVSGMDDAAQLTAVLRAVRASASPT